MGVIASVQKMKPSGIALVFRQMHPEVAEIKLSSSLTARRTILLDTDEALQLCRRILECHSEQLAEQGKDPAG